MGIVIVGLDMSITSGNGIPSPIVRAGLTGALIILRSVGWREGASISVRWGVHHQTDGPVPACVGREERRATQGHPRLGVIPKDRDTGRQQFDQEEAGAECRWP